MRDTHRKREIQAAMSRFIRQGEYREAEVALEQGEELYFGHDVMGKAKWMSRSEMPFGEEEEM